MYPEVNRLIHLGSLWGVIKAEMMNAKSGEEKRAYKKVIDRMNMLEMEYDKREGYGDEW